jgi:hypothetical protein
MASDDSTSVLAASRTHPWATADVHSAQSYAVPGRSQGSPLALPEVPDSATRNQTGRPTGLTAGGGSNVERQYNRERAGEVPSERPEFCGAMCSSLAAIGSKESLIEEMHIVYQSRDHTYDAKHTFELPVPAVNQQYSIELRYNHKHKLPIGIYTSPIGMVELISPLHAHGPE